MLPAHRTEHWMVRKDRTALDMNWSPSIDHEHYENLCQEFCQGPHSSFLTGTLLTSCGLLREPRYTVPKAFECQDSFYPCIGAVERQHSLFRTRMNQSTPTSKYVLVKLTTHCKLWSKTTSVACCLPTLFCCKPTEARA